MEAKLKPITAGPEQPTAAPAGLPPAARWAVASLSLAILLSSLGTGIANVALPTLAEAFAASFQAVQWIVLAYLLGVTTLIVGVGRLGDLFGRRRLLLGGLVLFTAASVLCAAAPALWVLIGARAVQGLGAAIMMTLAMALVGETVPKAKTGSAMGLLGTMSAIGTALGPSLGGVLIANLGWQAIFLINLPLGLLTLALVWRHLPPDRRQSGPDRPNFDKAGTLLIMLTVGAYALAMTLGRGHWGTLNLILLLAAGLGVALFLRVENRAPAPLIRWQSLRESGLGAGLAANLFVATVMMATLVVGPFYLSLALGLDQAAVGAIMSIGPVISALSGVPSGRLVDRLGAPAVVIIGLIAMALGAASLSLLPEMFGVTGYVAAIAVLTPGYQLFQAANNTAVMTGIAPDQRGVISGALNLSRNLGLVTGTAFMGAVFAFAAGHDVAAAEPAAIATGLRITFIVAAALIVAALAIVLDGRARSVGRASI